MRKLFVSEFMSIDGVMQAPGGKDEDRDGGFEHGGWTRQDQPLKERTFSWGGGVSTIRQYLQAQHIDEMHVAISPVMLGKGQHLFGGIDTLALGYVCTKHVASPNATHFVLTRQ